MWVAEKDKKVRSCKKWKKIIKERSERDEE